MPVAAWLAPALQWTRLFDGPAHGWDVAQDVAFAADGSLLVVGSQENVVDNISIWWCVSWARTALSGSCRRAWLVHNCLAHPLMALAPRRAAFDAHEQGAARMRVEGWA